MDERDQEDVSKQSKNDRKEILPVLRVHPVQRIRVVDDGSCYGVFLGFVALLREWRLERDC